MVLVNLLTKLFYFLSYLNPLDMYGVNLMLLKDIKWICQTYQQILKESH